MFKIDSWKDKFQSEDDAIDIALADNAAINAKTRICSDDIHQICASKMIESTINDTIISR